MALPTYEETWQDVLNQVEKTGTFKEETFKNWITKTSLFKIEEDQAFVVYRSQIIKSVIEQAKAIPIFEEILSEIWGIPITIHLRQYSEMEKMMPAEDVSRRTYKLLETKINPDFTFESFIEGQSNMEAYSACLGCAQGNRIFNPIMIYGKSGLGKTHLLHAIGNYLKSERPDVKIFYSYSGDLVSILLDAMKTKNVYGNMVDQVKQQLIQYDYFLIDDIQNLQQSSSQEVFFTVYNDLIAKGAQVVITSDIHPSELKGLQSRLVSRFMQGLTTQVSKPEFDTAKAILKRKIEGKEEVFQISDETLDYLAETFSNDVRNLEGSLNRLIFNATLENPDYIDLDFAMRVLSDEPILEKKEKIYIKDIKKAVTKFYRISYRELEGKSRLKRLTIARHLFVYLSRELINAPYKTIGSELGNRDHTTALNSYKKAVTLMEKDKDFKTAAEKIKQSL